jgi:hypothetical protein
MRGLIIWVVFCFHVPVFGAGWNVRVARGLEWLAAHQDREGGFWTAHSMNKTYPAGSMQENGFAEAAAPQGVGR